jgi:hypothetical protein
MGEQKTLKRVALKVVGYLIVVISLFFCLGFVGAGIWSFLGPHGGGATPFGVVLGLALFAGAGAVIIAGYRIGHHLTGEKPRSGPWTIIATGLVLGVFLYTLANVLIPLVKPDQPGPTAFDIGTLGVSVVAVIGLAYRIWTKRSRR